MYFSQEYSNVETPVVDSFDSQCAPGKSYHSVDLTQYFNIKMQLKAFFNN